MSERLVLSGSIYSRVGILIALFVAGFASSEAQQIASCDQTSSDKLLAWCRNNGRNTEHERASHPCGAAAWVSQRVLAQKRKLQRRIG